MCYLNYNKTDIKSPVEHKLAKQTSRDTLEEIVRIKPNDPMRLEARFKSKRALKLLGVFAGVGGSLRD